MKYPLRSNATVAKEIKITSDVSLFFPFFPFSLDEQGNTYGIRVLKMTAQENLFSISHPYV